MAQSTDPRYGELARGVLVLLDSAPDGLAARDVIDHLPAAVPPTPREMEGRPESPGESRYEEAIRRSSMELAKAGWLTKSGGTWQVTDKGRAALSRYSEPFEFYVAAVRRRDPTLMALSAPSSDVGDIFAGCFLSIAGSLVGAIIGSVAFFLRMLPDPSLGGLLVGFGAAFVVGVFGGLVAMWPLAWLVNGVGRGPSHAENIWVGATALAAGIAAAVTPSLLIAGG